MDRTSSPRNDDEDIEQDIVSKGLTGPLVTPADVANEIASEHYFTAKNGVDGAYWGPPRAESTYESGPIVDVSMRLLTFCVIVLRNGFTVTGESSCASPENFDAQFSRRVARALAVQKIWPLLRFRLKDALNKQC